jgi:uncharacterized protein YqeY
MSSSIASIEQQLNDQLKAALRSKDQQTANTIRMIKTRIAERRTAKSFSGEVDDALHVEVIGAYKRSMEKAVKEFEAAGERGREQIAELQQEIAFCAGFLPRQLDGDAVREAVRAAIAELGVTDRKMSGRVIGAVMKAHKGRVEAPLVKQLVEEELGS